MMPGVPKVVKVDSGEIGVGIQVACPVELLVLPNGIASPVLQDHMCARLMNVTSRSYCSSQRRCVCCWLLVCLVTRESELSESSFLILNQ